VELLELGAGLQDRVERGQHLLDRGAGHGHVELIAPVAGKLDTVCKRTDRAIAMVDRRRIEGPAFRGQLPYPQPAASALETFGNPAGGSAIKAITTGILDNPRADSDRMWEVLRDTGATISQRAV